MTCNGDGVGTCPEIWALGLRNPFRFSFDRLTGDMFIGDVGQGAREEIDYEPFGSPAARNYGWKIREGLICRPGQSDVHAPTELCRSRSSITPAAPARWSPVVFAIAERAFRR